MNPYLIIVATNIISQGFLLILTGTFWDDFAYLNYSVEGLYHQFLATGTPERVFYIQSVWGIPNYGYRIIVWICYCIASIMYYLILKESGFFKQIDSLIITLLFVTVPINTCRLTLCTVVYAFSVLFFACAFLLLIKYLKYDKSILYRCASLFLFFVSFFLNSNLFFYLVPLCYIAYHSSNYRLREITCNFFRKSIKFADFIILPALFFVIKESLFPTYGNYEEYNHFGIYDLVKGIIYTIGGVIPQIVSIGKSYFFVSGFPLGILAAMCMLFLLFMEKDEIRFVAQRIKNNWRLLWLSLLVLMIAAYPYLVVRKSFLIIVRGLGDRDSILLTVGFSIFIFTVGQILYKERKNFVEFYAIVIILGSIASNINYLEFQGVEYWQRSLAECMKDSKEVEENNTFLFLYEPYFEKDYGIRFYSLNGISAFYAFGNQNKCWLNGVSDLDRFEHITQYSKEYSMDDYDFDNNYLDGIVIYKCKYSLWETLKIKYYEMYSRKKYWQEIKSHGDLKFVGINTEQAKQIIGDDYEKYKL